MFSIATLTFFLLDGFFKREIRFSKQLTTHPPTPTSSNNNKNLRKNKQDTIHQKKTNNKRFKCIGSYECSVKYCSGKSEYPTNPSVLIYLYTCWKKGVISYCVQSHHPKTHTSLSTSHTHTHNQAILYMIRKSIQSKIGHKYNLFLLHLDQDAANSFTL